MFFAVINPNSDLIKKINGLKKEPKADQAGQE